jgi:hypothetical protein
MDLLFAVLAILFVVYCPVLFGKDIPNSIVVALNNSLVRLIVIALITYYAIHDLKSALLVGIAFMLLLTATGSTEHFTSRLPITLEYPADVKQHQTAPDGLSRCDPANGDDKYGFNTKNCEPVADSSMDYSYAELSCSK